MTAPATTPFSTESYFQTQRPPAGLADKVGRVETFVNRWKGVDSKRVVLVTVRLPLHHFPCLQMLIPRRVEAPRCPSSPIRESAISALLKSRARS